MTSNFKIVGDKFKTDTTIVMLSYSVTPWIDKPYVLKKYMKKELTSKKSKLMREGITTCWIGVIITFLKKNFVNFD